MTAERSEHLIRRDHYVAGRQDERARIIELMKKRLIDCEPDRGLCFELDGGGHDGVTVASLIELIDGENE
jgi:hypothetical protein